MATGCFVLFVSLLGCSWLSSTGPTSTNTPDEMFEALVQSPLPTSISHLEGAGDTWQGHSVYLRFQAPSSFIEDYTAQDFEEVPCESVLTYLWLPDESYNVFHPPWQPEEVTRGRCFRSQGSVGETWIGEQYLLWDTSTNEIYFYGLGI